ncbi:MAG: hypothetical protein ACW9W3_07515 [Candidatus Nitrosopumilus sp. bin_68KS]
MKSKLAITSLIAMVAIISVGLPSAMADSDANHFKQRHIEVTDFVGKIQITEDTRRADLREQVTVSLSEASSLYPDSNRARIGVVVNENDDKFLVWVVVEREYNPETFTGVKYFHIVDAADISNVTTVTQEIDNTDRIQKKIDRLDQKIDKISERLSNNPDDNKAEFLDILLQIRDAISNGDYDLAKDLRNSLKSLRGN